MKINVDIKGLEAVKASLDGQQKQVRFAAAKALTQTAVAAKKSMDANMKALIAGGPTKYTERSMKVDIATPDNLQSVIALRTDGPSGGTPYVKALGHLFEGGRRDWKKMEGWLRGRGFLPPGMMIAPGPKAPLDARGNFRRAAINEMFGILNSQIRNLRAYRRTGAGKQQKGIGFFVAQPGDRSGVAPGIWRRIETGSSSVIEPWIMFINPTSYRRTFDLERIVKATVATRFQKNFDAALSEALRTAR